jgi:hypothetical protein
MNRHWMGGARQRVAAGRKQLEQKQKAYFEVARRRAAEASHKDKQELVPPYSAQQSLDFVVLAPYKRKVEEEESQACNVPQKQRKRKDSAATKHAKQKDEQRYNVKHISTTVTTPVPFEKDTQQNDEFVFLKPSPRTSCSRRTVPGVEGMHNTPIKEAMSNQHPQVGSSSVKHKSFLMKV